MPIGTGKFEACRQTVGQLLDRVDLLAERNVRPTYGGAQPSIARQSGYRDWWETCIDNRWFDFKLADQSLLQFRIEPDLSFSFLEAPFSALSFEAFAARYGSDWEDFAAEIQEDYDLYVSSDLAERSVTPLRYDYSPKLYRAGVHPAGHLHIGLGNEIRICVTKIMNPISFALFMIRQYYPRNWDALISDRTNNNLFREIRDNLDDVPSAYCSQVDLYEVQLR